MPFPVEASFRMLVQAAIDATPIRTLLSKRPAVVLERVARGGGATNWYFSRDEAALHRIASRLLPGSRVSFYFDGRVRRERFSEAVRDALHVVIARDRGAVLGVLSHEDGTTINMRMLISAGDLAEELVDLGVEPDSDVFDGPFPGADNDGLHAVTLDLPDRDGVLRRHPH